MNTHKILLIALLLLLSSSAFAELILFQGFESSPADTWNYTAIPEFHRLGDNDQFIGSTSVNSGSWYSASGNLTMQNHAVEFESVQLSSGYVYTVKFNYFTQGLNPATEYSRYCIEYDNSEAWTNWFDLQPNTNVWTEISVEIPAYATSFRLKVEASYDGYNKYAHWDAFTLERSGTPPVAPTVNNVTALQRTDGSKIVDIHYNVYDANNDPATISVMLSEDSGTTFAYQPNIANLYGDIGEGIYTGTNKHIVWKAGEESIDYDGSLYRIRVLAEDNTSGRVETPIFSPAGGVFNSPQMISITCATANARIYYSTNGSDPDQNSTLYTGPINISTDTILKARAYKELWLPSLVATSATYIFPPAGFAYVPGGTFTMGDTRGVGYDFELPTHSVTLNSIYMSKYQVTQAQYTAIMGSNPARNYGVGPNYPVYTVNWYSTIKYCNLRSMNEGLTPVYSIGGSTNPTAWGNVPTSSDSTWSAAICNWSANGYRLPTEAEWEYAARSATNDPDYLYSGSDDLNAVGWYAGNNSPNKTKEVGTKAPNALGLYDMSGNLDEWCWDWGDSNYYDISPSNNPKGPDSGSYRVLRGGSFSTAAYWCRVAFRTWYDPCYTKNFIGFRVCRAAM
ncbi:MAG: SUMF1/EgtB/PvdO family nonheme iron enzyme [Candidatus Cloacimonetes bacterium]|nr:SUMF1/EgtB/PvdO family nonheme iron enzyme [Candidatus Cloacimonadota bacterium]